MTDNNRTPNVQPLRDRFKKLTENGLRDLKFWYVGGTAGAGDASVDDLCAEVSAVLDSYDGKQFVDITDKLK